MSKPAKIVITAIIEERKKALKVEVNGETFWIQRRYLKNNEISTRVFESAMQNKADFKTEKKVERAHNKAIVALPTADWASEKALGFDIIGLKMGKFEVRARVFIPKSKCTEINGEWTCEFGLVNWAIDNAGRKTRYPEAFDFQPEGALCDAARAA